MDLLHFEAQDLYFHLPAEPGVEELLQRAAGDYAEGGGEQWLLQALEQAPESLMVMVALYRFYFYQHRLPDAFITAQRTMAITSQELGISGDWAQLDLTQIGQAALKSMTLLRSISWC